MLFYLCYICDGYVILCIFVEKFKATIMENEDLLMEGKTHHGHNVKNLRKSKGLKQEVFAAQAHMSQQTLSRYEGMPVIDDEKLQTFAKALGVPTEVIKNMEEESLMIFIENNNIENKNGTNNSTFGYDNSTKHYNPIDKITELYERLLKTEQEKNISLEERLSALEKKMQS